MLYISLDLSKEIKMTENNLIYYKKGILEKYNSLTKMKYILDCKCL